jgi:hypothetical protein
MKRTLMFLVLLLTMCSITSAVVIDPSDSNIQYMGRWIHDNPSLPTIGWEGGAITVNFEGTGIKATIDADDGPDNCYDFFRVVIDDD